MQKVSRRCLLGERGGYKLEYFEFKELSMNVVINRKAQSTLEKLVRDGLSAVLSSGTSEDSRMTPKAIETISTRLVDRLLLDSQFIECVSSLAQDNKELM